MKFSLRFVRFLRGAFTAATWDDTRPFCPELEDLKFIKNREEREHCFHLLSERAKNKELAEFVEYQWNKYEDRILMIYVLPEKQIAYESVKAKLKKEYRYYQ